MNRGVKCFLLCFTDTCSLSRMEDKEPVVVVKPVNFSQSMFCGILTL